MEKLKIFKSNDHAAVEDDKTTPKITRVKQSLNGGGNFLVMSVFYEEGRREWR